MFSVSIAVRQRGTIDLQSGIFDRPDAIDIMMSMAGLSEIEAAAIISEAIRLGMHRRRGESFEILAKVIADDGGIRNLSDSAGRISDANDLHKAI